MGGQGIIAGKLLYQSWGGLEVAGQSWGGLEVTDQSWEVTGSQHGK